MSIIMPKLIRLQMLLSFRVSCFSLLFPCFLHICAYGLRLHHAAYPRAASISSTVDDLSMLQRQLSPEASIIYPNETGPWADATERWSVYEAPMPTVVVNAAIESDIVATVNFAREHKVPLLTRNRGHGTPSSLKAFSSGILLNIGRLNSIELDAKNNIAVIGGGVYNYNVTQALYAVGKQGAHGSCSCPGFLGIGLGGGHGRLEGMHGLVLDNILSFRVVLANGTIAGASPETNPDLFWALRGAGHNFGIVTSIRYRVYDLVDDGDWWWANYVFSPDKIESLFSAIDEIAPEQPTGLSMAAEYLWLDENNPEPNLVFSINAAGKLSNSTYWTNKFNALKPLRVETGGSKWNRISEDSFTGLESGLCAIGRRRNQYAASLKGNVNSKMVRDIWNLWKEMGTALPNARASQMVFEIYANHGVRAVEPDSTAYPHRDERVIALFDGIYEDASIDEEVRQYGRRVRDMLQEKSGYDRLKTYVNYAQGDEELGAVYGYEDWRLERLRSAKRKYDPEGFFSWYQPIPLA